MHPHLEKYLQQVSGELKSLSEEQRTAELREIGQHLQSLTDEGRERGLGETAAVAAALVQFGSYRKVGRDLNNAVRNKPKTLLPRAFTAIPFIMIAQVVLSTLLTYGSKLYIFWAYPILWSVNYSLLGGTRGAVLGALSTLALMSFTICLALSLRQLRPWAFWIALGTLSYKICRVGTGVFIVCAALAQRNQLSASSLGLFMLTNAISFLPTLFCLWVLVLNRKTYLRLARG